ADGTTKLITKAARAMRRRPRLRDPSGMAIVVAAFTGHRDPVPEVLVCLRLCQGTLRREERRRDTGLSRQIGVFAHPRAQVHQSAGNPAAVRGAHSRDRTSLASL